MIVSEKTCIFWFRRDLRLADNTALAAALSSGTPVLPLFIFDSDILEDLASSYDRRVDYMHQALQHINEQLRSFGSTLQTFHGRPIEVFRQLLKVYHIEAVYCNRDYEPQAIRRDCTIRELLNEKGVAFFDFKDHVIFEKNEIVKNDGSPYTVYGAYARKWRNTLGQQHFETHRAHHSAFLRQPFRQIIRLEELGFVKTDTTFTRPQFDEQIITHYGQFRDFPALAHQTGLGIALRFGTISIRQCAAFALRYDHTWLAQLIWREFFMQILYHFPQVVDRAFKPPYDNIVWRNNADEFQRWCEGKTGYPLVDAGMHQLNQTGEMHNRVRMVAASFLCKHLLIDWRWGEAYFAERLNDYDLAANNGNWQWVAGCGCDAAPYFRIFNPEIQARRFDKSGEYIRRWNPNYRQIAPIVEHRFASARALKTYKNALIQGN